MLRLNYLRSERVEKFFTLTRLNTVLLINKKINCLSRTLIAILKGNGSIEN